MAQQCSTKWLELAINPAQYDSDEMFWSREGNENHPTRKFFQQQLLRSLGDASGKKFLDIGCGTGHLSTIFQSQYLGIDPSVKNIEFARDHYPAATYVQTTLQDFAAAELFDVAMAVMVFEHIDDLEEAFNKIHRLLVPGGLFVLITIDDQYAMTPRSGYEIDSCILRDGESIVRTKRSFGTLYDIVRDQEVLIKFAGLAGFKLQEVIPMPPTAELMTAEPKYAQFAGKPITKMYIFQK